MLRSGFYVWNNPERHVAGRNDGDGDFLFSTKEIIFVSANNARMEKQSSHVKTKIAAGYVLLVAVCIAAIAYIFSEVLNITRSNDDRRMLHYRRSIVNQTLYHLYQAEGYGQMMIAGYKSYEARYTSEMGVVHSLIDSLRRITEQRDSMQTMRLDSISTLVWIKQRSTMRLKNTLREGHTAGLLSKNIEQLITRDSMLLDSLIRPQKVYRQDSVIVPREKRSFLRRVADIFNPPKEETEIRVSTSISVDSLSVMMADTIIRVLRTLENRVTDERLSIYETAWNEGLKLQQNNQLVNRQIYRLITRFEEDETAYALARYEERAILRRRSSTILGVIAGTAIVLMLMFVSILWRDIGRSNRYKRRLEEANRKNETLIAAREKMMLTITHDFKAPLGSIIGYIDLLSRLTTKKREEIYLNNMRESSAHLLALVNDLLVYYKLDNHKAEVNAVTFCPARLFDTVCREFRLTAEAKGLTITAETTEAASKLYTGDPFRIRQIADNLVSNAVKFTDKGGITLKADVADGTLVFSVRDTGRGMTDEEKRRVFGEFVRLGSARGAEGFGLGLSIVDRIVDLLGGSISVESRKGEGSEFRVSIPVKEAGEDDESAAGTADETPELKLKCLIVDDDTIQLELTRAMCERFGLEAECCQYPEYAVRLAAEGNFDLLMTDIQMPEMDGFRLLELVREQENGRNITAIAVSARSDDREEYLKRGFAAVLRKPFTSSELAEVLRSVKIAAATPDKTETPASGLSALTSFATDDPEAAEAILRSFVEQNRLHVSKLSKAAADGDIDTIAALAHKMLPIFTMIGCNEMEETLKRLERRETADPEILRREVSDLVEKVESIIANAEKEISLSGKESKDAPDSDR